MARKKFIVVSNRLPVSVSKVEGELVFTPSSGGLATALDRFYQDSPDSIWIGWPGICEEDTTPGERRFITKKLKSFGCEPIFLTRSQARYYYDGYSNDTIWPLFHYFQTYVKNEASYWQAYAKVNQLFADTVMKFAAKDSTIWVHDYHLMLLPDKLRRKLPEAAIGFFLHVPFPSYEIFRLLPNRRDILTGLLGADLIGFHVYDYARHFLSSVLRTMGIEASNGTLTFGKRLVRIDAFPIGIDYAKFSGSQKNKLVKKELSAVDKYYQDKKVILSMDRLDYSKGILGRLRAFEHFISKNPKYREKVVLVMVTVPSRVEVTTYKNLKKEIEQSVSRINGKYSTVSWSPISYQFKNLPFEQAAALLIRADVALLTPLRDGMNLVAKEYIAVKQDKPGVLILSELTGAIDEMPEVLRVNPNDMNAISSSIKAALEMPRHLQKQKISLMQKRLSRYTVHRWAEDFIYQLKKTKERQHGQSDKLLDRPGEQRIIRSFKKAKQRLIMLDYDGTLTELAASYNPEKTKPPIELLELLKRLDNLENTTVAVISGRPKKVMAKWFKDMPLVLSAEHGVWVRTDGVWSRRDVSLSKYRDNVMHLLEEYADRTPGAAIEEKDFGVVWHYRNVPPELAQARNSSIEYELRNILQGSEFSVMRGSKTLEIKPTHVNKGQVAEELTALANPDFILCIGDDATDENMFEAVPDSAFTIKVGLGGTNARFQLLEVGDVLKLLEKLIK